MRIVLLTDKLNCLLLDVDGWSLVIGPLMTGAYVQGHKLMCKCINSGTHNNIDLRFMLCVSAMFSILIKNHQDSVHSLIS